MSLLALLCILLSAVVAEFSMPNQQEPMYDADPAISRTQTPSFARADKCIATYSDPQEAYDACCPTFNQAKVTLDGAQYTIDCRVVWGVSPLRQADSSDPASCARQCTKTAGCRASQWDRSNKCVLFLRNFRSEEKPSQFVTMVRVQEAPGDKCTEEIEQLKKQNEAAEKEVKSCQQSNGQLQQERDDVNRQLGDCQKEVGSCYDCNTRLQDLERKKEAAEEEVKSCQESNKQLQEERDGLNRQLSDCQKEVPNLSDEFDSRCFSKRSRPFLPVGGKNFILLCGLAPVNTIPWTTYQAGSLTGCLDYCSRTQCTGVYYYFDDNSPGTCYLFSTSVSIAGLTDGGHIPFRAIFASVL
ncbi:hypothetical protein BDV34DRAFT_228563 [Aspergillus parasiticus]|uniref:Apple domain-containing protein n=1 Tax=Aspergillus parasiticus TaxID=5067 RepID=A0A5N6DB41_ASPPA|nr:hypothetical protein BDV34DRAFT_228563 [Aspergillus parasiticus]